MDRLAGVRIPVHTAALPAHTAGQTAEVTEQAVGVVPGRPPAIVFLSSCTQSRRFILDHMMEDLAHAAALAHRAQSLVIPNIHR